MSSTKKCRKRAKKVQHAQRAEARRHLSFDPLVKKIRERAEAIPDGRSRRCDFSLADAVMSAFAMFSLKDPSLLAFEKRRNDENIKTFFARKKCIARRACLARTVAVFPCERQLGGTSDEAGKGSVPVERQPE
jgi:hypothetical protein